VLLAIAILHTDHWLGVAGSVAGSVGLTLGDQIAARLTPGLQKRLGLASVSAGRLKCDPEPGWSALKIGARVIAVIGFCAVVVYTNALVGALLHVPALVDEIHALCLEVSHSSVCTELRLRSPQCVACLCHAWQDHGWKQLSVAAVDAVERSDRLQLRLEGRERPEQARRVTRLVKVVHGWLAQRYPPSAGATAEAQCERESRLLSRGLTAFALLALSLDGVLLCALACMLYFLRKLEAAEGRFLQVMSVMNSV
jgi:hypothetical protein